MQVDKNSIFGVFQDEAFKSDLNAAVTTPLTDMFGVKLQATFTPIDGQCAIAPSDFYGCIGLIQDDVIGNLVISFPHDTLAGVLMSLYRRKLDANDPACSHGAGEITNIVFCVLKERLQKKNVRFKMTVPQVTTANSFRVPDATWSLKGDFTTASGNFSVHVILHARTRNA